MQRIPRTFGRRNQRSCSLSRTRRAGVTGSHGNPATAPVETLAPAFPQALPCLDGQPATYSHEVNGEMLYELCASLLRMGLGTPELWIECGEDPLVFAQRSIVNQIGAETVELLERNVEYHLEVSDVVGEDSSRLSTGQLAITIHCSGCACLKIGPALRALESEEVGLGAAFYWTLIRSPYRVMRIYDHSDAKAYEENLIEYAQEDDPANRDQYEFPEVAKALPDCIRESLKPEFRRSSLDYRRMLSHHSTGRYPMGVYRDLYASSQRLGCYIETLARFRVDVSFVADLALMENGEDDFTAFGTVRRAWLKGRCIGRANVEGEYADIYALGWVSHLRTALAGIAVKLGLIEFDLSSLEQAEPRLLTHRAGRIAFEIGYSGVFYHSRYGHSLENWDLFEDWAVPERFPIHQPKSRKAAEELHAGDICDSHLCHKKGILAVGLLAAAPAGIAKDVNVGRPEIEPVKN